MSYNYFQISKKSNYAIRALSELAIKGNKQATNVKKLAGSQNIPLRFLEIILNELKQGGFVFSTRGKAGGYVLASEPENLTIGEVIRFLDKHNEDAESLQSQENPGELAVNDIVSNLNRTISDYFDGITLQDVVQLEQKLDDRSCVNFVI